MWAYDYYLKDGSRRIFYTNEPDYPEEVLKFCENHKDEIEDSFCDHYPMTVEEFIGENKLEDYKVICK